ncbi:hypothetical protein Bca4012_082795 [Brassica carinata]
MELDYKLALHYTSTLKGCSYRSPPPHRFHLSNSFLELSDLLHNHGGHQVVAAPDQCLRDASFSPPHLFVF